MLSLPWKEDSVSTPLVSLEKPQSTPPAQDRGSKGGRRGPRLPPGHLGPRLWTQPISSVQQHLGSAFLIPP